MSFTFVRMECSEFLATNVRSFVQSKLFKGGPAYPTIKGHRWYTWLYLARKKADANNNQIKVGITNNLRRRANELRPKGMEIQWVWSMPTSQLVEKDIKQILHEFIKPRRENTEKDLPGKTEIIRNIPFAPLILFIRLVILYVYFKYEFIQDRDPEIFEVLRRCIGDDTGEGGGRLNPNAIEYNGETSKGHTDHGLFKASKIIYQRLDGPDLVTMTIEHMNNYFKKIVSRKKFKMSKIQRDIKDVQQQIKQEEFDKTRKCNLNHLYHELAIDIDDQENFPKEWQPNNLKYNKSTYDGSSSDPQSSESDSDSADCNLDEDGCARKKPLNDNPPTPSRQNQVKKGAILYLAYKLAVTEDSQTTEIFRFSRIIVRQALRKKEYIDIMFDYVDLDNNIIEKYRPTQKKSHSTIYWPKKLAYNKERVDFRDRLATNNTADGAWGVYSDDLPNPERDRLVDGILEIKMGFTVGEKVWFWDKSQSKRLGKVTIERIVGNRIYIKYSVRVSGQIQPRSREVNSERLEKLKIF